MRILKHAILGFLDSRGQMSGYDITTEFKEREIGEFWSAKHSQIYPELKKLLDEKLIEYHIEIQGTKLEKKIYSITEKGRNELRHWLTKSDMELITPKDDFMLKAYFINSVSKEEAKLKFQQMLNLHRIKLSFLEERYEEFNNNNKNIDFESKEFGHYLVLTRARNREKAYVDWFEELISIF
ncbi:MAG: PadR family transcriptional regulator [Peptostreptococcaceae bacterium]